MDLSKAFDSMPHGFLIAKLSAYGVSRHACNLIINFLCNRRQRTKVMGKCSEWVTINRGVPQGSWLGPVLFNIFVNDLFYTNIDSIIFNYADDNHLVNESNSVDTLKVSLEKDAHRAISWFGTNYMDANPDKFQCISLMMTSSNGNIFRVTGPLCGEFTGPGEFPTPHKGQWRGALMFSLICAWINRWVNSREAGDLRRYRAHYDVIVMLTGFAGFLYPFRLTEIRSHLLTVLKYWVLLWIKVCSMIPIFQFYVPRHQLKKMPWKKLDMFKCRLPYCYVQILYFI